MREQKMREDGEQRNTNERRVGRRREDDEKEMKESGEERGRRNGGDNKENTQWKRGLERESQRSSHDPDSLLLWRSLSLMNV